MPPAGEVKERAGEAFRPILQNLFQAAGGEGGREKAFEGADHARAQGGGLRLQGRGGGDEGGARLEAWRRELGAVLGGHRQVVRRVRVVLGHARDRTAADEGPQRRFERVRGLLRIDLLAGDAHGEGLLVL